MSIGKEKLAILLGILANSIFGFSFLFSKMAMTCTSPMVLLSLRFIMAFTLLNLVILFGKVKLNFRGKKLWGALLIGIAEPGCYFLCENYGINMTSSSFAGQMIALIPVVALGASALFLHERPTKLQTVAAMVSVLGVLIGTAGAGESGSFSLPGMILLCGAVLSSVTYSLLNRKLSAEFSPFERVYVMFAIGTVLFTSIALFQCRSDLAGLYLAPLAQPKFLISLVYLAGLSSVAAFLFQNYAFTHLSVARVTNFSNLTTIFSIFAGVIFLHEAFSLRQLLGAVLIILGVYGVNRVRAAKTVE